MGVLEIEKIGLAEAIYTNKRVVFKKRSNCWSCYPERVKDQGET